MSRALIWAFVGGLILLGGAMLAGLVGPTSGISTPLLALAAALLAFVAFASFAMAWRTKGWSLRTTGRNPLDGPGPSWRPIIAGFVVCLVVLAVAMLISTVAGPGRHG